MIMVNKGWWVLGGLLLLWVVFGHGKEEKESAKPAKPVTQAPAPVGPVSAPTDGGSAFAKNLMKQLNEIERDSYLRAFVAVMEKGEADTTYQWTTRNAAGKIIAGTSYTTATRQHCRNFSESYVVGQESQYLTGIACQDNKGGWCKLRPTSTPNCIHTHPDGIAGIMLDTNIAIDRMNNRATQMENSFNSFKANLPF